MDAFLACRTAWDFGARVRRNLVPIAPPQVFNFDKAVHEALAVYYFPAMDEWNRAIVRPLAMQGFARSMHQDREIYEKVAAVTEAQEEDWQRHLVLGQALLDRYFTWALTVDEFDSIFSDEELWVPVEDPANPGEGMVTPDDRTIRYLGRMDQLISDPQDEHWIVEHRLVQGGWTDPFHFFVDATALTHAWAFEWAYPHIKIAGTVYNELRTDAPDFLAGRPGTVSEGMVEERDRRTMQGVRRVYVRRNYTSDVGTDTGDERAVDDETGVAKQETDPRLNFRRTYLRRSRASIRRAGVELGRRTSEMRDPDVRIYQTPTPGNCSRCLYRRPCIAGQSGHEDLDAVLAAEYRTRTEAEFEEERLRWSAARKGTRASLGGAGNEWRSGSPDAPGPLG
jgi:hypothetical protein